MPAVQLACQLHQLCNCNTNRSRPHTFVCADGAWPREALQAHAHCTPYARAGAWNSCSCFDQRAFLLHLARCLPTSFTYLFCNMFHLRILLARHPARAADCHRGGPSSTRLRPAGRLHCVARGRLLARDDNSEWLDHGCVDQKESGRASTLRPLHV